MASGDLIPNSTRPMGAQFKKPYMEFWYDGQVYRLENLRGGHNGMVAGACQSRPPQFDPVSERWVVPVNNNLIDIDLTQQPEVAEALPDSVPYLRSLAIVSNPRRSFTSTGQLTTAKSAPTELPRFPVDCVFNMHIRVRVPGKPTLVNVKPFQLVAKGLEQWPPPVGTVYTHDEDIELHPEWVPFGALLMSPIVRILAGDETILTNVFEVPAETGARPGFLRSFINRMT